MSDRTVPWKARAVKGVVSEKADLGGDGRKQERGARRARGGGRVAVGVLLRSLLWAVWAQLQCGLPEEPTEAFSKSSAGRVICRSIYPSAAVPLAEGCLWRR